MSLIKNDKDLERLRESGRQLAGIIGALSREVRPGVLPVDLDEQARVKIKDLGGEPAFLNYKPPGYRHGYPAALCVSVNEDIVHGIPDSRPFQAGDVVTLDLGLNLEGLITDMAVTVALPPVDPEVTRLLTETRAALWAGIKAVRPGVRVNDIGAAIESKVHSTGFGLVKELSGHGVGYKVHEEPMVPNFKMAGPSPKLKPGLVMAIEPMATLGGGDIKVRPDGFTFATKDGSISAHFEHTVIVTDAGVEVITQVNQ